MKKIKFKWSIAAGVLFLILPMLVFGESLSVGSKVFSIGPRATYSRPRDANNGKWAGGVQARLHLIPALALEGSFDYRRNSFRDSTTIRTYPVQASLLGYFMPEERWSPFLLAGPGWYYTRIEGPGDYRHTTSRFGFHAGGGLEVMLSDSVSLDGSYRYLWIEKAESRNINIVQKKYNDSGFMITMAVNFLFGFAKKDESFYSKVKSYTQPAAITRRDVVVTEKLIVLEDTHFEFDSVTLTKNGAEIVSQNIKILNENPKAKIRISGYASAKGTEEYNQELSERRASSVKGILIKEGVAEKRMTTIGYGKTRPAVYEPIPENIDSREARANMRVLFEIILE